MKEAVNIIVIDEILQRVYEVGCFGGILVLQMEQQRIEESFSDLIVRISQCEFAALRIIALDSQIAGIETCKRQIVTEHIAVLKFRIRHDRTLKIGRAPIAGNKLAYKPCRRA